MNGWDGQNDDGFGDLRVDFDRFRTAPMDWEPLLRWAKQYARNQARIQQLDAAERSRADWADILQSPAGGLLSNVFAKMAGGERSQ